MPDPSPQDQLSRLMNGYWYTQAIHVAARLSLADLLHDGPKTAKQLAEPTKTNPRALYRLLRALASLQIFAEDDQHRFSLTPMADFLRSDAPGSMWSLAMLRGGLQYEAWGQLLHSIQTGQPAFDNIHGVPLFDYFSTHPDQGEVFDAAMSGVHGPETAAMLDAFDFSGIDALADIGGGNGSVLAAVLTKYPTMHGVLFDLPAVVERARANIEVAGLSGRCRIEAGNFFDAVPAGADAYLLRHIIHDWDDDKAVTILKHCRKAMGESGTLLVVEGVIPPGNDPSVSKFFDLAMMVLPGGMERTEDEYRQLLQAAGFRLTKIVPTRTWISVIEGQPG